MTWDKRTVFIAVLCLVAAIYRFTVSHQYTLEWDEANILAIAKLPSVAEIIRIVAVRDAHPPAIEILLHFWIKLFGDSDFSVRNFTWCWGLLGLFATYRLAFDISKSRLLASATAAFTVFSPFIVHYSMITTFYSAYYALVLCSWILLLKFLDASDNRFIRALAYGVVTVLACYIHISASLFVLSQVLYVALIRKQITRQTIFAFAGIVMLVFALLSPYVWSVCQPWHLTKTYPLDYKIAPFWSALLAPINLLFMGYDLREFHEFPEMPVTLFCSAIGFYLLWQGTKALWKYDRQLLKIVFCIGFFPLGMIYLISVLGQVGIFQFRTFLYILFALHLLIAAYFTHAFSYKKAVALSVAFVVFQLWMPWKRPYWPDIGSMLAANVKSGFRPGDGVVMFPGWMSLVFLRYFDPPNFGLSLHERQFDPLKENHFTMVQRIDARYFMVSGEATLQQLEVKQAYQDFERRHNRIWLVSEPSQHLIRLFSCKNEYMVMTDTGQFVPEHCRKD